MSEMKSFIESQLKDMGFLDAQIRRATAATTCDSLDQVMEWILNHPDITDDEDGATAGAVSTNPSDPSASTSSAETAAAAAPVVTKTPEELAAEAKKLEERIKQRRLQREEEERQAEIERERNRRQTGSQIVQLREKVEMEERVRAAEDRKREKKEDAIHKQRILDEIKRDRENLKKKQLLAAGGGSGSQDDQTAATAETVTKPSVPAPQPKTVTDNCRLAIKLPDGSNLQQDFNPREPLAAVKLYVQLNRKDVDQEDPNAASFTFRLPPATMFTSEDMERPLVDLGLCPSSRLFVVRR